MSEYEYPSQGFRSHTLKESKILLRSLKSHGISFPMAWVALMDSVETGRSTSQEACIYVQNLLAAQALDDPKFGRSRYDDAFKLPATVMYEIGYEDHIASVRHIARFLADGAKVYEVSEGLTQRLLNTDVHGIPTSMLKLPYQTVCIRIPAVSGFGYDEFFVTEEPTTKLEPHEADLLRQVAEQEGESLDRAGVEGDLLPRGWTVIAMSYRGKSEGAWNVDATPPLGVTFRENEDLAALCNRLGFDFRQTKGPDKSETLVKFLINFVLYLSWPDTGESFEKRVSPKYAAARKKLGTLNGYKKERLRKQIAEMDSDERMYVGAKVPFLTQPSESGGLGGKLFVRSLVAGHWKMQPCGEGRKDRKLIRIEPYWRGPLDGVVENLIRRAV